MNEQPNEVYVILRDGERVDCLLEEIDPENDMEKSWQAVPVRPVSIEEVEHMSIDVLPSKHSISLLIEGDDA